MIGHVQIGNAPTRNEPGVGEVDLHYLIGQIDTKGYRGWMGLEYDPSRDTWSSLQWANRYGYEIGSRNTA
jgi:hydroxypyruvate isomerase